MASGGYPATLLDVILLGKTGQGKSTTGNKLINAEGENAQDQVGDGTLKILWQNVDEGVRVADSLQTDYKAVRFDASEGTDSVTKHCKVIINAATGFRVLDTRGFAPSDGTSGVKLSNLEIIREVVGVSTDVGLAYHRVMYFLPVRDIPERADKYLQEELEVLWHFFGDSVFKNMVIVMTLPARSKTTNPDVDAEFGQGARTVVEKYFEKALSVVIANREEGNVNLPTIPAVIFIPFKASAEVVARVVRNAKVCEPGGIKLQFHPSTCCKCASVILFRHKEGSKLATPVEEKVKEKILDKEAATCHPVIVPKHSTAVKFRGGMLHIATAGVPAFFHHTMKWPKKIWPWFTNSEVHCPNCEKAPSVEGCMKIGDPYNGTVVQHDNTMDDFIVETHDQ